MNTASQDLLRMGYGFVTAQGLFVAAVLGIADLLRDGSRSIEHLASQTDTDPDALYRVVRFHAAAAEAYDFAECKRVSMLVGATANCSPRS